MKVKIMLTIPQDLDEKIAENLRLLHANPDGNSACFEFVLTLFLDGRIYNLHDEDLPEDAWELEMATYGDVITLPDYIYDLVPTHPDPLVRRGWLTFCRQTRCISLKGSVREFLKDNDALTKKAAQELFDALEEAQHQRQEIPEADAMSIEQTKMILGDHLFSDEAKRKAIDRVWSFSQYTLLSEPEKRIYNQQCQPLLWEMMPLLMNNFNTPFTGDGHFKMHLNVVLGRAEPMSDALIEQRKNGLLYWWWNDATLSFAYGLAHAPQEKREDCINFMRDVLESDFYRLGKMIIRDQLESIEG